MCVHQDVWGRYRSGVLRVHLHVSIHKHRHLHLSIFLHVCMLKCVLCLHSQWFKSHLVPGHHIITFCLFSSSYNPSFPERWLSCGSCISLHFFKYGLVCLTLLLCTSKLPHFFPSLCIIHFLLSCFWGSFSFLPPFFFFFATTAKW